MSGPQGNPSEDDRLLRDCLDQLGWIYYEREAAKNAASVGKCHIDRALNVEYVEKTCEVVERLKARLKRETAI